MIRERNIPVLLIGNFLSSVHGNYNVCEDLAARLTSAGRSVITASNKPGRFARGLDMLVTVLKTRREYAVAHVDVYSGMAFMWAEAVCGALKLLGKPYVLTLRGGGLPSFARRWPRRVRLLLNSADAVIAPSAFLQQQMAEYRAGMVLQPNPLDLSLTSFRQREMPRPQLVWLRAFHQIYNPSLAPKVLALLAPEFPDIHLFMVGHDKGDGSLQEMQRVAKELGVLERITTPGGVPKSSVGEWLSKGDIFLNTTDIDNTPISVLEAAASGLCVVSTDVGGMPYLMTHELDALLVPPGDAGSMAAAVRRLLTESDLAARLSYNAYQKVKGFDWSVVLPQWEELVGAVAGEGRNARAK